MITVVTVLIVAATAFSVLGVFRTQGKNEIAWAALCLSLALLLPRLG